jgi:acetylornithine deacetylase/succinyl-diaminopimelate desuccinylase-like protein
VKGLEDLAGVPLDLEDDPDALVRYFSEPTTNIARLQAGPQGQGKMMSVNPSSASADMDLRLVPDQQPQRVFEKLEELARKVGEGNLELEHLGEMPPGRTPVDHPFVTLMSDVAEGVYGSLPILEPLSPTVGSRSVLSWSGMPVVGYGISYSGSNIQAPNEHIRITDYETGMAFLTELLDRLAQEPVSPGR